MEEKYLSLYDFLGKAAGKALGAAVNIHAQSQNIPIQMKEISNPKYKGKVLMYPESFLKEYFNK